MCCANRYVTRGLLYYSYATYGPKLIVKASQELSNYYASLIPKWHNAQTQRYEAHISVVRNEQPPKMQYWNKHRGKRVMFSYSPVIQFNEYYYWLDVFSVQLEMVRAQLGLPLFDRFNRLPEGFRHRFHITLANRKHYF